MVETLKNAWRLPELRKKLMYTLFILLVFRIGSAIPVPFIDYVALENIFQGYAEQGNALAMLNVFTGSNLSHATIFALGITPYINSSIILQLLTVAIPALENLAREGEEGRRKIASWTRYVTVFLALLQGFSFYMLIRSYGILSSNGWLVALTIIMSFTAGSAVVMWLGEHITQNGVGNGISLILFAGIISRGPAVANTFIELAKNGGANILVLLLMLVIALGMVAFIVFMSDAERRIPIQYAKRQVGRKMYGGQSTHLPIKVNATGVMPIIFTSSIMSLPTTIFAFWKPTGAVSTAIYNLFQQKSPFYIVLYALLIFAFSYFYASIQFNPIEIANNLQKNGGFIPGFRPGKPTAEFVTKALAKVVFVGGMFLTVVAVLPLIVGAFSTSLSNVAVGGTSVIIVVGVALETMQQIEAQMTMRHHKGFLE